MDGSYTYVGMKGKHGTPRSKGLVFGIGINDVTYLKPLRAGTCPYYKKWKKMLERSYDAKFTSRQETYAGVTVCEEWLTFSNFKAWMENQDWEGKQLDKDLLGDGGLYSPETCAFILAKANNFLREPSLGTERYPVGVSPNGHGRFAAAISDFTLGRIRHLGTFDTTEEAHLAWLKRKKELAYILADFETDPRVKRALRLRYQKGVYIQRRRVRT